jgi:hypothetical protein
MTPSVETKASELGLFVLSASVHSQQGWLLDHLRARFEVRGVHEVHWAPELAAASFARLFPAESALAGRISSDDLAAETPLLVVTVVDREPRHRQREASRGTEPINVAFAEAATALRARTTGGWRAYGVESAAHAARDLMLLLGTDPGTYLGEHPRPWVGTVEQVRRDLSGAEGWASPAELFHVLNHTVRYLVIRNFEGMPQSLHVNFHEDVDLLTDDYPGLAAVMNARPHPRCILPCGGPHWVRIAGKDMWFDLRFVGDRYFDPIWAGEILDGRVYQAAGFYSPNPVDYFESLAYHAVIHKPFLSEDYKERLAAMAGTLGRSGWERAALDDPARVKALLDGILRARGCAYRRPLDVNVFYNFAAAGHRWPAARRKLAGVFRKAVRLGYRARRSLPMRAGAPSSRRKASVAPQTTA